MATCAQCGTPNDDSRAVCPVCGGALTARPAVQSPTGPAPGQRTMLGIAPPGASAAQPGQAPADPKQTMLGGIGPPASGGLGATLVGTADPIAAGQPGALAPAAPNAPVDAQPAGAERPGASSQLKQTMLGMAPTPDAAPPGGVAPPAVAPAKTMLGIAPAAPQPPPGANPPPSQQVPSQMKTMLGVAMPGIAPLNPGLQKAEPPRSVARPPPAASVTAPTTAPTEDDFAVLPGRRRRGVPVVAVLVILFAVVLATAAGAFALFWRSPKPLRAEVVTDAGGKEMLAIVCDGCADGTTLSIEGARAVVKDKKARLGLAKPLTVGDNELTITIERGGGGRTEDVDIVVPVEYRLRGDFSILDQDPPKLRVTVEAAPETAVVVDGQPVELTDGKGVHDVIVTKELSGPADERVPLTKKVPYTVTLPDGSSQQGEVTLSLGIVPLRITAPGPGIVVDRANFMLAGRTQKGGSVTVSGRPITVDAAGRFAQLMNVSSTGETVITVRASAPKHAPRLVPIRVKRVKSLVAEAATFRKRATDSYSGISTDIESKQGWAVVLEGRVLESRVEEHATILLVEATRGCSAPPCIARLVHGARVTVKKGDRITAFGHLTRAVEGLRKGRKVPEIAVDFVLGGSGK